MIIQNLQKNPVNCLTLKMELLYCNEQMILKSAHAEKTIFSQLKVPLAEYDLVLEDNRVLKEILSMEKKYLPSQPYLEDRKAEIQPWMRSKLILWMFEVCREEAGEKEVFPSAVNLLDRVLSRRYVKRTQLQLLGSTCMFIASKLRGISAMDACHLVYYAAGSIETRDIIACELDVLNSLNWDICSFVAQDAFIPILSGLNLEKADVLQTYKLASDFVQACLVSDLRFSLNTPSVLAASSICNALEYLKGQKWMLEENVKQRMAKILDSQAELFQSCFAQMAELVKADDRNDIPYPENEHTAESDDKIKGLSVQHSSMEPTKSNVNTKNVSKSVKESKSKKPVHPTYKEMVKQAIVSLNNQQGSSRQAILKYIMNNFNLGSDVKQVNSRLKLSLRAGMKSRRIKQTKGTGVRGSFTVEIHH